MAWMTPKKRKDRARVEILQKQNGKWILFNLLLPLSSSPRRELLLPWFLHLYNGD